MKFLMNYRCFPVAMGRYIHWALERLGHTVILAGENDPRGPEWVPWGSGFFYPDYACKPDIKLVNSNLTSLPEVLAQSGPVDAIIQMGDICWLRGDAPEGVPNIMVATDPHAVEYSERLIYADKFFNMQNVYMAKYQFFEEQEWMPYGFDPTIHKPIEQPNNYDIVFIGLQYDHRMKVLQKAVEKGWRVFNQLGVIYDESNKIYNQGHIAYNWSSQLDVPARVFEGLASKRLLVTNRLPDLSLLGFVEGVHYVGYDDEYEAINMMEYYLNNPDKAREIAEKGYEEVQKHSWDIRAQQIVSYVENYRNNTNKK